MKKKIVSIVSFMLVLCMMISCVPFSAFAATEHFTCVEQGSQATLKENTANPLSAWKTTTGKYGTSSYSIQLQELYVGTAAYNIVKAENKFNEDPSSTQQWILMKFNIKNNSSSDIKANNILTSAQSYFTASGNEIKVAGAATFSAGTRKGVYGTTIAAGQSETVWHGILIDKAVGYPVISIPHSDLIYYSYINTAPKSTTPTPTPTPTPSAPDKAKVYKAIYDYLDANYGRVFNSSATQNGVTVRLTIDCLSVADSIFISYYIQEGLISATLNIKINSALNGVYPVTLNANYGDVGKKGSLQTTLATTAEGPYNITSLVADSDFYRNDLKGTLPIMVDQAMTNFATLLNSHVNAEYSLSSLGFSKNFICPTGHSVASYTYNNNATATKDGTKTGVCSKCGEKVTITAIGTKTAATQIKDSAAVFKDVKNEWYKKAVDYNYSNSFVSGMESDKFGLQTQITRGMFITILARIAGVDTTAPANQGVKTKFTDVASDRYFSNAVKWGYESGVVSGTSDTTFSPETNITREQLCVMIVNFAKAYGVKINDVNAAITFADNASIAGWSKDAVSKCQKAGIVSGYVEGGKTYFKPQKTATRAEAAQILYKFHSEFVIK